VKARLEEIARAKPATEEGGEEDAKKGGEEGCERRGT
jgi:hypothetical protein